MQADINLLILNDANLAEVSKATLDTFAAPSNTYDHTITKLGAGGVMLFRNRDTISCSPRNSPPRAPRPAIR